MEYQLSSCVYISVTGYLFVLYRMGIYHFYIALIA